MTRDQLAVQFAEFGRWVLIQHREHDCGDVTGDDLQDKALALGLLVKVPVIEPCGEGCACAEWGDFPQDCLRLAEEMQP